MLELSSNLVLHGDCAAALPQLPDGAFQAIYVDPPFNTGGVQTRRTMSVTGDEDEGTRTGFGGKRWRTEILSTLTYADAFDDYLGWLEPKAVEFRRLLSDTGTLYFHIDWRESHYCKVLLDAIFGRDHFLNEVIWAYDYGGRRKDRWPTKHDTILVYVKDVKRHRFEQDRITRIPYLAPKLVGPEKAARGKLPTDVWWRSIVGTTSKEKTGYPTQKPVDIVRRALEPVVHEGDWVLDCFAGSGTTGEAATALGAHYVLIDESAAAIDVMRRRLPGAEFRQVRPER